MRECIKINHCTVILCSLLKISCVRSTANAHPCCHNLISRGGASSALRGLQSPNWPGGITWPQCLTAGHLTTLPKPKPDPPLRPLPAAQKKRHLLWAMWFIELTNLSDKTTFSAVFNKYYLVFHSEVKFLSQAALGNNIKIKLS